MSSFLSGWGNTGLRNSLNSTTELNKLGNKTHIKEVKKTYLVDAGSTEKQISNDKLWLLACSEIWNAPYSSASMFMGCYGLAKASEGKQYKYYKEIVGDEYASVVFESLKGNNIRWLRSPYYKFAFDEDYCTLSRR